ncbi:NKIRAS [Mytilus coruscus]|uniref:NKIRAS n=1 Tax=Mytilus coruscus TaxID=42192 RepID=A0A6J8EWG8_MYTCO|nr:NKIRAS [Mytilus coruscus]
MKFANVGKANRRPYCLCASENDLLVIYLSSSRGCTDFLLWMNTDGMVITEASVSNRSLHTPCFVRLLEPYLCVLYHTNNSNSVQRIELLKKKDDTYNPFKSFSGMFGYEANRHFQCHGMCVAKDFNIIISDFHHRRVYVLDKELKYKKTLFGAIDGLDQPAAIGILNDYIWVADINKIFVFHFAHA